MTYRNITPLERKQKIPVFHNAHMLTGTLASDRQQQKLCAIYEDILIKDLKQVAQR